MGLFCNFITNLDGERGGHQLESAIFDVLNGAADSRCVRSKKAAEPRQTKIQERQGNSSFSQQPMTRQR